MLHGNRVLRFDHSMQCFSSSSDSFKQTVRDWMHSSVIREWKGATVGSLSPGGKFHPRDPQDPPLYVGAGKVRKMAINPCG